MSGWQANVEMRKTGEGPQRSVVKARRVTVLLFLAVAQVFTATGAPERSARSGETSESIPQQKADCVTSSLRGSMLKKDAEYVPVYCSFFVGKGGNHCWTVDSYSPYAVHWYSDGPNKGTDYLIYKYDVGVGTKQVYLELKGGSISFGNPTTDKGKYKTLRLAVFDDPAPITCSSSKDNDLKKTILKKSIKSDWGEPGSTKSENVSPQVISLQPRGRYITVVLAGHDSSSSNVRVDIRGLRLSKPTK